MQNQKQKVNKKIFFILFAFFIVVSNCFSYKYWNVKSYIYIPFYAFFVIVIVKNQKVLHTKRKRMTFSKLVTAMIITPFFCFISYINNGDVEWTSHPVTFIDMCGSLTFLLYFVLHALKVNERTLLMIVFVAATCILCIQIFQQFFPSHAVFGVRNDFSNEMKNSNAIDIIEMRNGLYRYRILGKMFTIIAMCYTWQRLLKKQNLKNVIFFLLFAVSMYLYLTRQYMIATIGMCAFSIFLVGKSSLASKMKFLIPIALLLFVLYM